MGRMAVTGGGKRDEIVAAAMDLFLEQGFDGTSVRGIMKKAGGEIGLFYYYFESKDDVFDKVLERFFGGYQREFARIAQGVYRDPFRTLTRFFEYMKAETIRFRKQYAANIHRTVRWAIRERTLAIITPYLRQILGVLAELGAKPPLDLDVTAVMLAHGVGSMILHEDSEWMERSTAETQRAVHLIMGLELERAELLFPAFLAQTDIPDIVRMAEGMKEQFPGFEKVGFTAQLDKKVKNREALAVYCQERAVGCIVFSHDRSEIDFLAVDPEYRCCGIAARLLITAMSEFPVGAELAVTTYREGDPLGIAARRLYQRFGFREGELLSVYGYPCQRLTGVAPACLPAGNTDDAA